MRPSWLKLVTLRRLTHGGQCQFVVPARVARLLQSRSIGPVHELDWGESLPLARCTIHSVPALHFSARTLFDRNRTLWCGYVIDAADRIVYFAGDTAFGAHFAQIRVKFGPPALALLPIGAYEPRWFMQPIHMNPAEAVQAHVDLEASTSVGMHFGTFRLTAEGIDEPLRALDEACRAREIPRSRFRTLRFGESLRLERRGSAFDVRVMTPEADMV